MPGDYDGDGRMDIAVYRPFGALVHSEVDYQLHCQRDVSMGTPGDIPVPGDDDGDGSTDVAVYRPSNGTWHILQSNSGFTAGAGYVWGAAADVPVPGDYDGDGKTDIAVYRPSTAHWFILKSTTGFTAWSTYQWGSTGDIVVPADYDGDRKTDVAVYRPSNGTRYILLSSTGLLGRCRVCVGRRRRHPGRWRLRRRRSWRRVSLPAIDCALVHLEIHDWLHELGHLSVGYRWRHALAARSLNRAVPELAH